MPIVKKHIPSAQNQNGAEDQKKTRYSDEELKEFQILILNKLEKARGDLKMLLEALTGNPNDDGDTSPTFKVLEEGYSVNSKEENKKLAAHQEKFITALENALVRIENKIYGICRVTGKLISKERLRIVPHTTLSIEAKLDQKEDTPSAPVVMWGTCTN